MYAFDPKGVVEMHTHPDQLTRRKAVSRASIPAILSCPEDAIQEELWSNGAGLPSVCIENLDSGQLVVSRAGMNPDIYGVSTYIASENQCNSCREELKEKR